MLEIPLNLSPSDSMRFFKKVNKTDSCWLWTGVLTRKNGYGRFRFKRGFKCVHRISWTLANGAIPIGMRVLHRCDNPPCLRPDHLYIGTQRDNMRDCVAKGRRPDTRGENGPLVKLTWQQVEEIRRARLNGATTVALAAKYNVVQGTIGHITKGRTWKIYE